MADLPKPPSTPATPAPSTGGQEMKKTLDDGQKRKLSTAEKLRRRDELAYSPAVLGENVTKVFGARIATNVERELTDVFGSKIGASIREARRAEPGKKLSTFGRTYLSQLTTSIGGMGIIGEGIANRLRDQRKFEDDPQKEFEKIKGNFIAVSKDLKQINENFEKLKKSQEEVAKEVKKTTNLITDLNNTATRLERDFKEFQDVNFRQFKENVETRLSKLEGMSEMRSATGFSGQQMKTGKGGTSTGGGTSLTDLALTAAGGAAAGSVAARALGYAKAAGRFALRRSPYLLAGYGLYKGIETIGQANEARDKELGIDRNDPRMLTPEGQAEIEEKRRAYHGRRKRGVNEEYRAQLEEAKKQASTQSSASKPASQKKGLFGLGGFPDTKSSAAQQYAQRFKKESSFGESFDRQMIEREKSRFLQFGQLPSGFEFLPGHMGRLGSPEAVAARGIMPLGGYGGVAGVPGMPSGGYSTGGGNAAGYTTGPTANVGREGTYAGGRTGGPPVDDRTVYGNRDASKPSGTDVERTSHPFNVEQRAKLYEELRKTPGLKEWVAGVIKKEGDPTAVLESLVNRALMDGKTLADATNFNYSGNYKQSFFGPVRREEVNPSKINPHMDRAFREVFEQGSNIIGYRTDQGYIGMYRGVHRNEHGPALSAGLGHTIQNIRGEHFSQMGKKGAQFAQRQEQQRAEWERRNPNFRQQQGLPQSQSEAANPATQQQSTPGTSAPSPAKPETQAPVAQPQALGVTTVPGIVPKQSQQQQLMPGVSLSSVQTELLPGLAKQQPGKVEEAQQTEAAHRKLPISEQLKKQLAYAASEAGVEVRIASGGQDPRIPGTTPPGASARHNYGNAADLDLYVVENGKRRILDMRNPADAEIMEKFARAAVRAGATGIGAGIGYMGAHRMHIGGGPVASWGARGGTPPTWITRALAQGMKEQSSFNLEEWIKKNKGPIKVEAAPCPIDGIAYAYLNQCSVIGGTTYFNNFSIVVDSSIINASKKITGHSHNEEQILNIPLTRVWQYLRIIKLRTSVKNEPMFNRSDKVRGAWLAAQNKSQN